MTHSRAPFLLFIYLTWYSTILHAAITSSNTQQQQIIPTLDTPTKSSTTFFLSMSRRIKSNTNNNNKKHFSKSHKPRHRNTNGKPRSNSGTGIQYTVPVEYEYEYENKTEQRIDKQDEAFTLRRKKNWQQARPIRPIDLNFMNNNLRTQCIGWDERPVPIHPPPTNQITIVDPWRESMGGDKRACKVFVRWKSDEFQCSATLVSLNRIALSRSCTFSKCHGGRMPDESWVSCGYGWQSDDNGWKPHMVYDHWGSARITGCMRFKEFDDSVQCVDNKDVSSNEFDVQYCYLDRGVGVNIGWFGLTSTLPTTSVIIRGYPSDPKLVQFYGEQIKSECLYHEENVDGSTDTALTLNGAWLFPGENGAGYINNDQRVAAVHRTASTGCVATGTRFPQQLLTTFLNEQIDVNDYCELVPYYVDIYNNYGGLNWGVGPSINQSITVPQGSQYQAVISLFNPGNKPAINITVNWWLSTNDAITNRDQFLGTNYVNMTGWETFRIFSPFFIATQNSGDFWIGATWGGGGCRPRRRWLNNQTPSGKVNFVDAGSSGGGNTGNGNGHEYENGNGNNGNGNTNSDVTDSPSMTPTTATTTPVPTHRPLFQRPSRSHMGVGQRGRQG
jgi:hypothetical protein